MKMTSEQMMELLLVQENDRQACGLCWQITTCTCGEIHTEEDFSTFVLQG